MRLVGTIPSSTRRLSRRLRSQGRTDCHSGQKIKGYGLGEAGEGKNITHQQKKLNDEELRMFRSPLDSHSRRRTAYAPFYRPADDSRNQISPRARKQLAAICRRANCAPTN